MMSRLTLLMALILAGGSLWVAAAPLVGRVFGQPAALASSPDSPAAPQSVAADLGPVLAFAPFGLTEGAAVVAVTEGAQTDLVLLGITMAQTQDQSRAIIAGGDGATQSFAIGDAVRAGMTLTGVFADHVMVSVGGQDQQVFFQPGNPGVTPMPSAFSAPVAEPLPSETRLGRYRAEILQDPSGLLARLGLTVAEGGYLVTDAAGPEVLQAGLQPGDLISAANGQPLGDPDTDLVRFDLVAALGTANLSVVRAGSTLLMTFPLK